MPDKYFWVSTQVKKRRAKKFAKRKSSHAFRLKKWKKGFVSVYTVRGKKREKKTTHYTQVRVPDEFSLLQNPKDVLLFVNRLKEHCKFNRPVNINLKGIRILTNDAIALLLSVISEFTRKKIAVVGSYPDDDKIRSKLEQSGFFTHMIGNIRPQNAITKNTIFTERNKTVSSELSSKIIESASLTVFGDNRPNEGLYRLLIECMTNTFDHADLKIEGHENWCLSIEHDDFLKKVSFAFVDNGSGILKSIIKTSDYKGITLAVQKFLVGGNSSLLERMLKGDLRKGFKSRTGKPNRGKGIPGIFDAFKRNSFSNLQIITNDVHAILATDEFKKMEVELAGTFIYVEYDSTNQDL